jgi:hypothetical protein
MKKNKWNILGNQIDKENSQDYNEWFYFWYDGEYDYHNYCDNCGNSYCQDYQYCQTYDYLEQSNQQVTYLSKSFGNWSAWRSHIPLHGRFIDMMSIYPKSELRQKKIDYLLGIDKWEIVKNTTIGDVYEERRNTSRKLDS